MENTSSAVDPSSDSSSDSGDVESYDLSSPDGSYESDSDVDIGQYIIVPSIPPPPPPVEPLPMLPPSANSNQGCSGETDVKLSEIASDARAEQRKANGGSGKAGSITGDSYPEIPPGFIGWKRAARGFGPVSKRPNTGSGQEGSGRKLGDMFRRIFSEEDEIVLIQCMISYGSEKKADPFEDVNAFLEFVKPNLQFSPNAHQLLYKMRKIKTKYEKNKRKEESGQTRTLKAHEQRAYELSKLVNWSKGRKGRKLVSTPKPAPRKGKEATLKPNAAERMEAMKTPVGKTNEGGSKGKTPAEKANAVGNKGKTPVEKTSAGGNEAETLVEKNNAEACMNGGIPEITEIVSWNQANMDSIGGRMFEGEKRVEGEAEWRKLKMKENEMYRDMLALMCAKAKLISRGLKNEYYGK